MPATLTEQQERWHEIVREPALRDLPYKVETNDRGQLVLSPHKNRHSKRQKALQTLLDTHAPRGGESYQEYALVTPKGVKAPDVVWISAEREREMDRTGDPSTLAPEICVEIMSASNTEAEMQEKRALYREIGAEEVWVVDEEGDIRVFADEERGQSGIAPDCPDRLDE
ncbi:MAG: Uma2 family endonuclease [Bacteroidetes bacterium SW_9_63_38]|nr:MAG: Uma2 family endonuclease [Bacteroidetes bacterium SW_9_63_38]